MELNIVVPMAGRGSRFAEMGYTFPKPLIPIRDKTMIEVVIRNLTPEVPHKFIFVVLKEHYEKYDLHNVLRNATGDNFELIVIEGVTEGAACTILMATDYISNDNPLLLANSDQYVDGGLNDFLRFTEEGMDGAIMTFESTHPKWSYARVDEEGDVIEVAEKRVISNDATVGIYWFRRGLDFVDSALGMIDKDIRHNGEFYTCPVYNEMVLADKEVKIFRISNERMHGLGTPEDLEMFIKKMEEGRQQ